MACRNKNRPKDLNIIIRKLDFNFIKIPRHIRYWFNGDPIISHFFNSLQATFPEGEKFFIQAAIDGATKLIHKGKLPNQLKTDMVKFIHQEAQHSQHHKKWTDALISIGYQKLRIYDNRLKKFSKNLRKYMPVSMRLAITAAAEHYTASLAYIFTHIRPELLEQANNPFRELLLYHAMEEVEHKSVCFDLYQCLSGHYFGRLFGFFFISFDLIFNIYIRFRYLMKKDGIWDHNRRGGFLKFLFGEEGLISGISRKISDFIKISFHPWLVDERKIINTKYFKSQVDMEIEPFDIYERT